MSALDQKQTYAVREGMSASPPKADMQSLMKALTALPQQRASLPHDTIPVGGTQVTPDRINWSWRDRAVALGIETRGKGPVLLLLPALSSISTRAEMRPLAEQFADDFTTIAVD